MNHSPLPPNTSAPYPILVTGCAGFIGSHLVDRLLAEGFRVIGIDNFDPYYDPAIKRRNLSQALAHPNFTLIEADIRDYDTLKNALLEFKNYLAHPPLTTNYSPPTTYHQPPTTHHSPPTTHHQPPTTYYPPIIVHLAARAGVRPSIQDPIGYYDVNVRGTQNLLELAKELGVKKFIFASSSSVYGVNPNVPWPEDGIVLRPISPYGASKVAGELLGHVYSHLYGIQFIALRIFTVYGPRQRPDLAIHKFARLMLEGKPIPIYGDGSSLRDYTYVGDIVEGIRRAMDYEGSPYEVINLGSGRPIRLLDMVKALEEVLGVKAKIEFLLSQAGDVQQTWANIAKARDLLKWKPQTAFSHGIRMFADWLKGTLL